MYISLPQSYLMLKFDTNNLHTVIWFKVFQSIINNLYTIL